MSLITVMLAPTELMHEFYFNKDQAAVAQANLANYTTKASWWSDLEGEDAAEEVFDITNNPSMHSFREQLYGPFRSVSVGDVVKVDEDQFLCCSFGWMKL